MKRFISIVSLLALSFVSACASPGDKTAIGAGAGTALGAGLGAIIGSATGDAGPGIAIGAGSGAVIGAALGNALDAQDERNDATREALERNRAQIEENQRIIDELRRRGADVRRTDRGVVINLPDVLFEFDSYQLTSDARATVQEISNVLGTVEHRSLAVEGHTDSIGSTSYNYQLSLNRARSVSRALQRNGIPSARIRTEGFGEGQPIATNNSEAGRARNRRVEIIVEN